MVLWRRFVWVAFALGCGLILSAGATLVPSLVAGHSPLGAVEPASAGPSLVINEVAWSGTPADEGDQWIELYNPTESPLDLDGWTLALQSTGSTVALSGVIEPQGFYLLEANHDGVISDILADLIASIYMPSNGDTLGLYDPTGTLVDSANGNGGEWPGGIAGPEPSSMERVDPNRPDHDDNWASNDGVIVVSTPYSQS
jgi:hypothetical protein